MRKLFLLFILVIGFASCNDKLWEEIEMIEYVNDSQRKALGYLRAETAALLEQLQDTTAELQSLIDANAEGISENTQAIVEANEAILENTDLINANYDELAAADGVIISELDSLGTAINEQFVDVLETIEDEVAALEAADIVLTQSVADALAEAKEYADDNDQVGHYNDTYLQNAIVAINANIDVIEEEVDELQSLTNTLSSTLITLTQRVVELEEDPGFDAQYLEDQIESLTDSLTILIADSETNTASITALQNAVDQLEDEMSNLITFDEHVLNLNSDDSYTLNFEATEGATGVVQLWKGSNKYEIIFNGVATPWVTPGDVDFSDMQIKIYAQGDNQFEVKFDGIDKKHHGIDVIIKLNNFDLIDEQLDALQANEALCNSLPKNDLHPDAPDLAVNAATTSVTFTYNGGSGLAQAHKVTSLDLIQLDAAEYTLLEFKVGSVPIPEWTDDHTITFIKANASEHDGWDVSDASDTNIYHMVGSDGTYTLTVKVEDQCGNVFELKQNLNIALSPSQQPGAGKVVKKVII